MLYDSELLRGINEKYQQEKTYCIEEVEIDKNFIPEINKKTIIKNVDGKFTSIIITGITYRGITFEILDSNGNYTNISGFKPCPIYYKLKEVK